MASEQKHKHSILNKIKRHPIISGIISIVFILIIGGSFGGYEAYNTAKQTSEKVYEADNNKKVREVNNTVDNNRPLSVLLLGTDTGALNRHDTGRTDTMMIATINPKKKTTHLVSIPRDTRVSIPGDSQPYEKINAAYTIGGSSQAVSSVQKLLNIPIEYYVLLNMGGLEQMVNAVGGVTVDPQLSFKYENINMVKGQKQTLNGSKALSYTRMRYSDPLGDYGRQMRQREVLEDIVKKGMQSYSISRYKQLLNSLSSNLKTDLQLKNMISISTKYNDAFNNVQSDTLQGKSAMIDGISYQIPTKNEISNVSNKIRSYLDLNEEKQPNTNNVHNNEHK